MAYATSACVAAWTINLISGASDFSTTTTPTQAQVNGWLSSGSGVINARLQSLGYTPPGSGTSLYDALAEMNTLYAAARAEMARTNVRLSPGDRTRGQVFMEAFNKELDTFCEQDLARAGMGSQFAGYVGGRTLADKESQSDDSSLTQPRFARDRFREIKGNKPA